MIKKIWLVILVMMMIFVVAVVSNERSSNGGGTITITDIPSMFDGMYIAGHGHTVDFRISSQTLSLAVSKTRISNGRIILPMWVITDGALGRNIERYSGSHYAYFDFTIFSSTFDEPAALVNFHSILFADGSATISFYDGNYVITHPRFPAEFRGTWKREPPAPQNTLTITALTYSLSNQSALWVLYRIVGDTFYIILACNPSWKGQENIKYVNGTLVISGCTGDEENNCNGVWIRQ